jgi:hypothetical protein
MDKQDADRALDAALKDLEHCKGRDTNEAALYAAVVLIGRRLVPTRTTADDATMPGKAQRMAERRQSAGAPAYPGPAAPRVDPTRKERRWVDEQGRARRDMAPVDAPPSAIRALYTSEPTPDEVPDPVGVLAWSPGMDETPDLWPVGGPFGYPPDEADPLAAKDRAELAATLTELETSRRAVADALAVVAQRDREISDLERRLRLSNEAREEATRRARALHGVIDEARSDLSAITGADGNGTLTFLVNAVKDRMAFVGRERDGWIRSFSKVGEALGCPGGEPAVLAAISTLKDSLRVARERGLDLEKRLADAHDERAQSIQHRTDLRYSMQRTLGLSANALDSVIIAKAREAVDLLKDARETCDGLRTTVAAAREKLTASLGKWPPERAPVLMPDLVDIVVTHIEVLRSEHAHERTTVDELRGLVQEVREEADGALAEMTEHRERWERVRPLLAALESWATSPPGRDADTPLAGEFDRWQIAEGQANDDGPADVPHQPDDPGVTGDDGRTAAEDGAHADGQHEERGHIVAYLRRVPVANAVPSATYDAILDLAHEIERGAHVGFDKDAP